MQSVSIQSSPQPNVQSTSSKTWWALLVLMWMHYKVRRRRYIVTFLEFVSPALLFLLMFLVKDTIYLISFDPTEKENRTALSMFVEPYSINQLPKPQVVAYYPANNLTDELMAKVGKSLTLTRIRKPNLAHPDFITGYFGSNDQSAVKKYMKNYTPFNHAFVLFHNVNGTKLPIHLNYTIRMNKDFHTHDYKSSDKEMESQSVHGLDYAEFVRLQWAIDLSFLELRAGHPIKKLAALRQFPIWKPKKSLTAVILLMLLIHAALFASLLLTFEFLMTKLIAERASGIQELIQMVGVTPELLGLSHFLNVLPGGVVYSVIGAILLTSDGIPVLEFSNGFLIICDFDLKIINVNSKFGGATHDSHIWSASHVETFMRGLHESGEHVWLRASSIASALISRSFCCRIRASSSSKRRSSTAENSCAARSNGVGASLRRARSRGRPEPADAAERGVSGVAARGRRRAGGALEAAARLRERGVAGAGDGAGGGGGEGSGSILHCLSLLFLLLHFVSIVAMAFVCSFITNEPRHSITLATLLYFGLMVPAFIVAANRVPRVLVCLTGVLPYVPAVWFNHEITYLEITGEGLSLQTMMSAHTEDTCSVFWAYLFLVLQSGVLFWVTWYLGRVRPRKYGTAQPWNFCFRKEYWSWKKVHVARVTEEQALGKRGENKYFEPHSPNSVVGIDIKNVSKVFNGFVALNNVSLPVLKGEITILLGHNGAGKTTLMSIVTGTLAATSGKVFVNGLDTVTQQHAVRSQLGFCPQHNLFFSELTVLDHARFFCLMKGTIKWKQSKQSSLDLLQQLGLKEKANALSSQLSGGMKRRLQLACALAGDADVLVLDEPTAGLDVETRRGLWDLLLSLRSGRTVLLSTHFMEEADALGDRVAALHTGTLRCNATPMHLKKEIDTGYNLAIALKPEASPLASTEITNIIKSFIPQATLLPLTGINTLSYKLPSRECNKFPAMFQKLEESTDRLDIESISVGVTTLEEVFVKLCSDVSVDEDEDIAMLKDDRPTAPKLVGVNLLLQRFVALFVRQLRYVKSSWKMFVLMELILPILTLCAFTFVANEFGKEPSKNRALSMDLNVYKDMSGRRALSSFEIPLRSRPACCGVNYTHSDNIPQTLKNLSKDRPKYNKYLIGIQLNDTHAVAHYSTSVRHALPVAVNALTNAIASTLPSEDTPRITTYNYPLQDLITIREPLSKKNALLWAVLVAFIIEATLINALVLPCSERLSSSRHIHFMSGCSPELHWTTSMLFQAAYSMLVLVIPTLLFAYTIDKSHTLSQIDLMFPLALLLIGGCLSTIALIFLVSFMMPYRHAATALVGFLFVFSFIFPSLIAVCDADKEKKLWECIILRPLIPLLLYTVTPTTFLEALKKIVTVARINAYCNLNKHLCPNLVVNLPGFDTKKCCSSHQSHRGYLAFDEYSPLLYIAALYIQFFVIMVESDDRHKWEICRQARRYAAPQTMLSRSLYSCTNPRNLIFTTIGMVVVLTERGVLSRLEDALYNFRYKSVLTRQDDETILKEQQYVDEALKQSRGDAMLVSSVHKRYPGLCQKPTTAVKGISFAVREGECFGLVGVNGAGKSTTFKMMTCETFPTRGRVVANDQPQRVFDNSKFLKQLGYCPQFFGLDDFMTGRQNLEFLLTLDGLDKKDTKLEAVRWLELIDLMKYADRPMSSYSGGCARRLSSVGALARRAALSLLDEPTAGVDVAARRQLWRAVRAARAQRTRAGRKRAVLITSHSMDEMEALCSRVGIMSAGTLVALGSPAALRAAHHAGVSLYIKIKDTAGASGNYLIFHVPWECYICEEVRRNLIDNVVRGICGELRWLQEFAHQRHKLRSGFERGNERNLNKSNYSCSLLVKYDLILSGTSENSELLKLKQACEDDLWTLKDEHKTMLSYHVDKSLNMSYSEIFTKLEQLRKSFPNLIEDYAVTATTLEEVFLTYAKTQAGGVQSPSSTK
ncbi:phospholipid-transporting ATPase ABCA3 [Amyelois transitella]|uniref:phospholipid-transporting ATPase ABCA3 n=1 Tax=Amyelois transitella TaxID=680683 RepID=UPI00298F8B90|nr:phospholipid-transporting ATPase ABCA3 [Amyelois transitella]